jgi:hypothetical protein
MSHDTKQFKMAQKGFLYLHSLYSLDEYLKKKLCGPSRLANYIDRATVACRS